MFRFTSWNQAGQENAGGSKIEIFFVFIARVSPDIVPTTIACEEVEASARRCGAANGELSADIRRYHELHPDRDRSAALSSSPSPT